MNSKRTLSAFWEYFDLKLLNWSIFWMEKNGNFWMAKRTLYAWFFLEFYEHKNNLVECSFAMQCVHQFRVVTNGHAGINKKNIGSIRKLLSGTQKRYFEKSRTERVCVHHSIACFKRRNVIQWRAYRYKSTWIS